MLIISIIVSSVFQLPRMLIWIYKYGVVCFSECNVWLNRFHTLRSCFLLETPLIPLLLGLDILSPLPTSLFTVTASAPLWDFNFHSSNASSPCWEGTATELVIMF